MIKILGISGSLRKASFTSMLLQAWRELLPVDAEFRVGPMDGLPLFSEDHVAFPAPVEALRQAAGWADGFLIATPEYNHSIPGGLKNALDWLSRPPKPPCSGKPLAIVGAATPFASLGCRPANRLRHRARPGSLASGRRPSQLARG